MSPGPSFAIVAKHSLAGGRWHGLATSWAHAFGIGVYATIALFGLTVVMQQQPTVFRIITVLGALYLGYLGWGALTAKSGIVAALKSGQAVSVAQAAKEGALISLLSPKIMLFFVALFSPLISPDHSQATQLITVATPFVVDGLWYTLLTFMLSSAFFFERLRRHAAIIDRASGVLLIGLAIYTLINV